MTKTRVLIVDDHAVVRAGLRALLDARPEIVVVGEANCGAQVLAQLGRAPVDVVLLDIAMPGTVVTTLIEQIRVLHPATRILVLTMHDDPLYLRAVQAAGALGYVTKSAAPTELVAGIRAVHAGQPFVAAVMAASGRGGSDQPRRAAVATTAASKLSSRERQVLDLLARGQTYVEIARALRISVHSVGTYRSRVAVKLGVCSRAELVQLAHELGLGGSADGWPA